MLKLEAEIGGGRLSLPAGDNVMDTLQRILALVPDATPRDLVAIDEMPSRFDQGASEARTRGDEEAAERFLAFRDAFAFSKDRTTSTPGKTSSRSAPATSSPAASQAPLIDLPTVVKRSEPKLETDGSGSTGSLRDTGRDNANPLSSPAVPIESHPLPVAPAPVGTELGKGDQAKPGGNSQPPAAIVVAPVPSRMIAVLLRRGEEKLVERDISAARLLFERAAEARSGPGAFGMAKTYDPVSLAELGATRIQADAGLATEWYEKAIALGEEGAAASLSKLERWKSKSSDHLKTQAASSP